MDNKKLFTETPPTKLFFRAAIPGAIGMLASSLYTLADGMLVGRILGDTAFAALNLAMPFVIINFSLADLIGVGSAVPISIRLGEKNEKEAGKIRWKMGKADFSGSSGSYPFRNSPVPGSPQK